MKKREIFTYILIMLCVFLIVSVASYFLFIEKLLNYKSLVILDQPDSFQSGKILLKECPDEWIKNKMPGETEELKQYFIINGKRREVSEFDLDWIKSFCKIKPKIVY